MSLVHWVWLRSVLGCGSRRLHTILETFGDPQTAYSLRHSEQMRTLCLPVRVMQNLQEQTLLSAMEQIENCNAHGVNIIPYNSPDYPPQLRNIEDPPTVLYAVGQLPDFNRLCSVAMVGTRRATEYGMRAAFSLSYRLARAGCLIVSGMADGIDNAVHRGAMAAETPSVALLPCGHGKSYSRSKQNLLDCILSAGGCLLSELPPGTPLPRNGFLLRNRLISGMAHAVVVVQAPAHSGALITAACATQQDKEIFAVTGLPGDASFAGAQALIKDGAVPVFHARDILEALPSAFCLDIERAFASGKDLTAAYHRAFPKTENTEQKRHKTQLPAQNEKQVTADKSRKPPAGLSQAAAEVYRALSAQGDYMDVIIAKTGLDSGSVLSAVTELEINGYIRPAAGGKYILL